MESFTPASLTFSKRRMMPSINPLTPHPTNPLVMSTEKKEYILCAAIWYGDETELTHSPFGIVRGHVVSGYRHCQIIELYHHLTGKETKGQGNCQGFLTSDNLFVTRERAAVIAFEAGQIKEKKHTLYSEDIY